MDESPSNGHKQNPAATEQPSPTPIWEGGTKAYTNHPAGDGQNPGSQKQPTHSLKILFHGHSGLEWIEMVLTTVLAVVGIFYTFYAAKQWEAMLDGLKKTDAALEYTRQALELNRQALELNKRQTEATETSAKVAGAALSSSDQSFRTDERPYLVLGGVGWVTGFEPTGPRIIRRNADFKNIGKTPALNVHPYACLIPMDNIPENGKVIDDIFARTRKGLGLTTIKLADRAPQEDMFFTVGLNLRPDGACYPTDNNTSLTPNQFENYSKGTSVIAHFGGVVYRDSFGRQHETQFCELITPTSAPILCPNHNTIN
jgi:hypothetical protein